MRISTLCRLLVAELVLVVLSGISVLPTGFVSAAAARCSCNENHCKDEYRNCFCSESAKHYSL